ncbi:head GIN domain-containing protein [Mucilaginibacter sp.]|uniref:head GIN domain-containing protein n=1 Tax=Mucilaginibacter sp. TaxID=1882438 RepID=UPI00262D7C70|nr:head GIN domain-containing protein [Mucilaginibacter sp.]MDB4926089.1 hypothetical protein [Mucilaginibacter sp.]
MKLIKIFIALILVTGAGQTFAKSKANSNDIEDRHLTGFHAVDVAGSFNVYITQGATESVKVEAPANIIRHIVTEVKGGTLKIFNKDHFSWGSLFGGGNRKIVIYVTIKDVNSIALTGSGDVYFKDGINANTLRLSLTGSGDLYGKINVKTLVSDITGSGDIKVSGRADNSKISITGSGDYSGRDLVTVNTVAHVGGSGDASVDVNGNLEASVTGSGDVHYSGNPKSVSKSKTGSGSIERN